MNYAIDGQYPSALSDYGTAYLSICNYMYPVFAERPVLGTFHNITYVYAM